MHVTSLENLQKCLDRYLSDAFFTETPRRVVDIGSMDVNGSYRSLFVMFNCEYVGFDLEAGPGVDVVLDNPYRIPLADGTADVVVSGQTFEHCEFFWEAFREMIRILSPNGLLFLVAPSAGPIHRYPVDCYRFYPDAYYALARFAGCHLVAVWRDERGPWEDLTGVFSKDKTISVRRAPIRPYNTKNVAPDAAEAEMEKVSGKLRVPEILKFVHDDTRPRSYLEIGVRRGRSLSLARCPAVAVDPEPELVKGVPAHVTLFKETSDDFFEFDAAVALKAPLDLVFIDGMHLFEFALRDFMNAERYAHSGTIVLVDDIFPNEPRQALRDRQGVVWAGDVWKLLLCLKEYRPDLHLIPLDASPSGLLMILGLNPKDPKLWKNYNIIVPHYNGPDFVAVPNATLAREGAYDPNLPALRSLLAAIGAEKHRMLPVALQALVRKFRDEAIAGKAF